MDSKVKEHWLLSHPNRLGFVNIARTWKLGTLKDDGKRAGSEKGFRR